MEDANTRTVIYDLGANTGEDIGYYLLKADRVVAVEANPVIADQLRVRFADAIAQDRLRVENCVLVAGRSSGLVPFYLNTRNHHMSRFLAPHDGMEFGSTPADYDRVDLPSLGVCELFQRHGDPWYVKSDLEFYDAVVWRDIFENGIFPPLISSEAIVKEVFLIMVELGGYKCFKLLDGSQVGRDFANHTITTRDGPKVWSFPNFAAGPFGDDLPGVWRDANAFFRHMGLRDLAWKDIHASRIHTPVVNGVETLVDFVVETHVPRWLQRPVRALMELANHASSRRTPYPAPPAIRANLPD